MKRPAFVVLLIIALFAISTGTPESAPRKNAVAYYQEGADRLNRGEYRQALHSFTGALAQNPAYLDAIIGLARVYHELGVYDRSLELYARAEKIGGETSAILTGDSFVRIAMGNFSGALQRLTRAESIDPENLEAKYGIAYLYYMMGKKIWAGRQLEKIFRLNPFHYQSLLLAAAMKGDDRRYGEAKDYIDRAIETVPHDHRGYVRLAEIHYARYFREGDGDSYAEAEYSLKNALAIRPGDYQGNRLKGVMLFDRKLPADSIPFFVKAGGATDNQLMTYNLAVVHESSGERDTALRYYLEAMKALPSDTVIRSGLEDFLVLKNFKIGHPARILLNREELRLARDRQKRHLSDEVIMYLRRTLMLNPMDADARELLMEYYSVLDYDRFYVNEIKELMRLYPDTKYEEQLKIAVLKRRGRLYYREGYFPEAPPRNVPRVLVLDLTRNDAIPDHLELGPVLSSYLTFTLGQFGRMEVLGLRPRGDIRHHFTGTGLTLESRLEKVGKLIKDGKLQPVDFLVYGTADTRGPYLNARYHLYDFNRGIIITEFDLSEKEKDQVPSISLRAAKKIYEAVPFQGKILKTTDTGIIVNLGRFDGLTPGSEIFIRKRERTLPGDNTRFRTIIFTVKEADTLVSLAEPKRLDDMERIEGNDMVYPLKQRRAKLIK